MKHAELVCALFGVVLGAVFHSSGGWLSVALGIPLTVATYAWAERRRRRLLALRRRPPEGVHGQRAIDGGYFSVWACPNGHHEIGEGAMCPDHRCRRCETSPWLGCTRAEAHAFIVEIEGPERAHDGVGFRLL